MRRIDNIEELAASLSSGPAMMRLTEKQRRYVLAMAADPCGDGRSWAVAAGYADKTTGAKVEAHRLNGKWQIEAAVLEVAKALMFRDAPLLAVAGLLEIARNKRHPKQLRALETLANRVGLHELSEHRVRVEHTEESAAAKAERIRMVAGLLGVDVSALLGANNVAREAGSRETKPEQNVTNVKDVSPKLIEHAPQAHRHSVKDVSPKADEQ